MTFWENFSKLFRKSLKFPKLFRNKLSRILRNIYPCAIEESTKTLEEDSNCSKPPRPVTPYANDDPEENDYSVKESVSTASTYIENDISAKKPEVPQVLESSRNSQVSIIFCIF